MSISKETRENLAAQICELEALQSVYPKELTIGDHGTLADINECINSGNQETTTTTLPRRLEYSIEIAVPEGRVELEVNLPSEYPKARPDVYARSCSLDRIQQTKLNETLEKYARVQEIGEPCIYSLVTWIQDNTESYLRESKRNMEKEDSKEKRVQEKDENAESSVFGRYWVYSHHIYSNLKRKDIIDHARENSLSGFCLAGKPGIICIEGDMKDCEYWWQKIKVMNWCKILVKLIEEEDLRDKNIEGLRKFTGFHEIAFPRSEKHNDMGQLFKYLAEHESQHVFKELFGVEGKTSLPVFTANQSSK